MKIFRTGDGERHWVCGHWNGSPLEIGLNDLLLEVPDGEVVHHHPFTEYYVGLEGSAQLEVGGHTVPLVADSVVMVEAGERHRVTSIAPGGARWVVIKERSEPGSKWS